jgi:hypothetical protein
LSISSPPHRTTTPFLSCLHPHGNTRQYNDVLANNVPLKDEYSILNSKHFIGIHGYVIVYSVASKQSFEMARVIRDKILNHLVNHGPRPTTTFSLRAFMAHMQRF